MKVSASKSYPAEKEIRSGRKDGRFVFVVVVVTHHKLSKGMQPQHCGAASTLSSSSVSCEHPDYPHSSPVATQSSCNSAAMWASSATMALLTCPNRAACACTLSPSVSFLSHANSASSSAAFEPWRRTRTRLVRVMSTADVDSSAGAVEVEGLVTIDQVSN